MKKIITLSFTFVSFFLFGQNPTCDGNRYLNDIFQLDSTFGVTFGNSTTVGGTNADLKMDIYEPLGDAATKRPVIILAFGGSFVAGDRTQMHDLCRYYSKKGYVTASIDYRIYDGPVFPFPDSIDMTDVVIKAVSDMKAAVRFFREDAYTSNTYKIDTNFVFVGGVSAGAIVADHVGMLDSTDMVATFVDSIIQANGGWQGNSSTNTQYWEKVHGILNFSGALKDASYIDANDPPLFSVHDDGDGTVPYAGGSANIFTVPIIYMNGSYLMDQECQSAGVSSELITIVGSNGHVSYFNTQVGQDSILDRSRDFLYPIVCAGSLGLDSEQEVAHVFNVYPNPTSSTIHIAYEGTEYFDFQIVDLQGREVINHNHLLGNQTMDLSELKSGTYIIRIQSDHLEVKKLVVE
ncbi:MAG: T9SS type A sorting domain-containing protein [Crocinitomicaceae bacterium]|nr:T9SS type A sorting domain-containing protein [Crocinitomicaceae bacterium]